LGTSSFVLSSAMNKDTARKHLQFLERQILPKISGESFIYEQSKSTRKRKQESINTLSEMSDRMEEYGQKNKDLIEFYAASTGKSVHFCYHFNYDQVEVAVKEMIQLLKSVK